MGKRSYEGEGTQNIENNGNNGWCDHNRPGDSIKRSECGILGRAGICNRAKCEYPGPNLHALLEKKHKKRDYRRHHNRSCSIGRADPGKPDGHGYICTIPA